MALNMHTSSTLLRCARLYMCPSIVANVVLFGLHLKMSTAAVFSVAIILCLLASFGFLINDVCDRRIDFWNNRGRLGGQPVSVLASSRPSSQRYWLRRLFVIAAASGNVTLLCTTVLLSAALIAYSVLLRSIPFLSTWLACGLCHIPDMVAHAPAASERRNPSRRNTACCIPRDIR